MSLIAYSALPGDARERLLACVNGGSQSGLFVQHYGRGKLLLALAVSSVVAATSLFPVVEGAKSPGFDGAVLAAIVILVTLPTSVYAMVCLLELIRSIGSRLQPFILVSPVELIRGDFDHGTIEFYRLADATEFHAVDEGRKGLRYEFKFANDPAPPVFWPTIRISDSAGIRAMDDAVGYARAIKDDPGAKAAALAHYRLIPEAVPIVRTDRPLSKPFSAPWVTFWLGYFAIACLALIVAVIIGRQRR